MWRPCTECNAETRNQAARLWRGDTNSCTVAIGKARQGSESQGEFRKSLKTNALQSVPGGKFQTVDGVNQRSHAQDRRVLRREEVNHPAIIGRRLLVNLVNTQEAAVADESRSIG